MLSRKSKFVSVMIAMMLVLSLAIPVFADDGVEPEDGDPVAPLVDEPEGEETSSKFLDHPIVKLLAEFFFSFFNPSDSGDEGGDDGGDGEPIVLDEEDSNGAAGDEGEGDGDGNEPEIVPVEKIASMKEDDELGFGVIAKLMGIVVKCPESGVTLDDLVADFKGGIGLGELFELYCKPDHLGVGQIRKELKELNPSEKTNNGKAKGKNK